MITPEKFCPLSNYKVTNEFSPSKEDPNTILIVAAPYTKSGVLYGMTDAFKEVILPSLSAKEKFKIWCILLENYLSGNKRILIGSENIKTDKTMAIEWSVFPYKAILQMFPTTSDIVQRILGVHILLGKKQGNILGTNRLVYQRAQLSTYLQNNEPFFSQNIDVIESIAQELQHLGLINITCKEHSITSTITLKGNQYYYGLHDQTDSNLCFVAMKFGTGIDGRNMEGFFETVLKPAVDSIKPFEAKLVSSDRDGQKICDKIIADIRKSKFLIVDLTHGNNGAYFEAGFAHALNKAIIYICERKWFCDGDYKMANGEIGYMPRNLGKPFGVHFDIEHYPITVYDATPEGYEQLQQEIVATIEARILK